MANDYSYDPYVQLRKQFLNEKYQQDPSSKPESALGATAEGLFTGMGAFMEPAWAAGSVAVQGEDPYEAFKNLVYGTKDYQPKDWLTQEFQQDYPTTSEVINFGGEMLSPTAAASVGKLVARSPEMVGNTIAAGKNFIEGYYGPAKYAAIAKWLPKNILAATESVLDPRARALYAETGINRTSQREVKNINDKIVKLKNQIKAGTAPKDAGKQLVKLDKIKNAQLRYNALITEQAGREVPVHPVLRETNEAAYIGGVKPLSLENYMDSVEQFAPKEAYRYGGKTLRKDVEIPKNVTERIFEAVKDQWKNSLDDRNILMGTKEVKGSTGDHIADLVNQNGSYNTLVKLFEGNKSFDSVDNLKQAFQKASKDAYKEPMLSQQARDLYKAQGKTHKQINKIAEERQAARLAKNPQADMKYQIVETFDDGLLIHAGRQTSQSYLEGGINMMWYVKPDGQAFAVISDVHDFLENLPLVAKRVAKSQPNQFLGITPPIPINLHSGNIAKKVKGHIESPRVNPDMSEGMLQDYIKAKPSTAGVMREAGSVGQAFGDVYVAQQRSKEQ